MMAILKIMVKKMEMPKKIRLMMMMMMMVKRQRCPRR